MGFLCFRKHPDKCNIDLGHLFGYKHLRTGSRLARPFSHHDHCYCIECAQDHISDYISISQSCLVLCIISSDLGIYERLLRLSHPQKETGWKQCCLKSPSLYVFK